MRRWAATLAIVAAAGGCDSAPSPAASSAAPTTSTSATVPEAVPWPALPDNPQTLGRLLDETTRRSLPPEPSLTGKALLAALRRAVKEATLAGGWPAIVERLTDAVEARTQGGKRAWLLIGSHHDAPDQVDLFRRLTGPLGLSPAPLAAVEQLQADGRWAGLPAGEQRGDDALLARYLGDGVEEALAELRGIQRERNYTAWKYDYVERVADVIIAARASGRPLVGCDMPSKMQARLQEHLGREGSRLRDLHCALAIQRQLAAHPRACTALLIGDAHLAPDRLPRFVPTTDAILRVHLLGGRDGGVTLDGASRLQVIEPILFPLAADRFALVLHAPPHAARVDRVRLPVVKGGPKLAVRGTEGRLQLGVEEHRLDDGAPYTRPSGSGPVGFVLEHEGGLLAGSLTLPARGGVTLDLQEPGVVRIEIADRR